MKTLANCSYLFAFSAIFLLSACQPKDVDLKSSQNVYASGKDQKPASIPMSQIELNNLAAVSIERAIEPLHLLKATLDSAYAEKFDLEKIPTPKDVESDELTEEILQSKVLDLTKNEKRNRVTNSQVSISYRVDEFSIDPTGKLRKLVLQKNIFEKTTQTSFKASLTKKDKQDDFQSESVSERISIRPSVEVNTYVIKILRSENTNSFKDKKTAINTESKIKVIWDGQTVTLDQPLKIIHIEIKTARTGDKAGNVQLFDPQPELIVQLGDCVSMTGKIKYDIKSADQKITNPAEALITDSTIEIQALKFQSKAQSCESRPIVDLSRML